MASRRKALIAGGALAGTLLLGTAALALAQDPTPNPSQMGPGMISGGVGMMGGHMGMMGGQMGAGMMGGTGMMGTGTMTSEQLEQMDALHDQMVANGTCDPAQMQSLHAQHHPGN